MDQIIAEIGNMLPPALGMIEVIEIGNPMMGNPMMGACVPRGSDIDCDLEISLEEYFKGGKFEISFEKEYIDKSDCSEQDFGSQIGPITIEKKAYLPTKKTKICSQIIDLAPFSSEKLVFQNEGNGEGRPGDLIVHICINSGKDSPFKLKRSKGELDLHLKVELSLQEALLGFEKSLKHPSGEPLELICRDSVLANRRLVINGKGIEGKALFISFSVKKEDLQFSEQQRSSLKEFFVQNIQSSNEDLVETTSSIVDEEKQTEEKVTASQSPAG